MEKAIDGFFQHNFLTGMIVGILICGAVALTVQLVERMMDYLSREEKDE